MSKALEELEEQTQSEEDYAEVPPSDIVAYNELRSCADLYRMHDQGILEISPEFQRDIVWKGTEQTRFIDSLIKQLPIPSMCFALDHRAQKWIVIDGLQRMSTIVRYLKGGDWKLSVLDDIDPNIAGKSVAAIRTSDKSLKHYYSRVENLSIPITVIRCDFNKKIHMEYLFTIFHRLNTGGMKLNNQEIRNCLYVGSFNRLLKKLDEYTAWRRLNKMKKDESDRFRKQELLLRFFAFSDLYTKYTGHLSKFLNSYMQDNKNPTDEFVDEKRSIFHATVDCIYGKIFNKKAPSTKISVTVLEAILVGVEKNLDFLSTQSPDKVRKLYKKMINHSKFSEASLKEGLSKKPKVIDRLKLAIQIFSGNSDDS